MDHASPNSFDAGLAGGMSAFAAIVATGSFRRASEHLDVSPPAVTRLISRLEERVGVRLLNRTTRSVSLTDEGRQFYERIAPLLEEMRDAANSVSSSSTSLRGRLRLNVDPFFSRLILASRLSEFTSLYPAIELEIITRDSMGDLVADGFDLCVRFGEPPASSLVARRLLTTRILTVASPEYLRGHGRPEAPGDLADDRHRCILYRNPDSGRPFPWEFHSGDKRTTVNAKGTITLNDVATMHTLCLAGQGVAQVMELGCENWLADGSLIELFPDWQDERFSLYAIYPSRQFLPKKMRLFLDFVVGLGN